MTILTAQPRTITINDQAVLWEGQGAAHVTSHDHIGHVTYHPPPSRRDIRRDIYNVVYGAGKAVSRAEIAKLLTLKKTPWLLVHIEQLVTDGYLVKSEGAWRNGFLMYFYQVKS